MGRGFLAGLFWGFIVGAGMLLVSSQALDRQELSLPQPEASTVEVPGGSEFDQARVETDPVLPESDTRPEGETTGLAAVPDDTVDAPPAFDTTALEVPTPSVGEAGELSEAPATSDAPEAPEAAVTERPADSTSDLVVPESPGTAPEAGGEAVQPEAPVADEAGDAEAAPVEDEEMSDTDLAVLQATEADQSPGADTGTAPAVTTEADAPSAPSAPAVGDEPALQNQASTEGSAPRLPQITSPTQPEAGAEAPDVAAAPTQPEAPVVPVETPESDTDTGSLLQPVDSLTEQAETVETDRLPRIGDADTAGEEGADDDSLPTIRRLGNEATAEAEEEEETPEVAEETEAETEDTPSGPAIVAFGKEFSNANGTPLLALVLVQEGDAALDTETIEALPASIAFALDAGLAGADASAARYRSAEREVVMIPSLPDGARPQDVEQALRVNFEVIPEAVAIMDVSGSSFQSDRAAVEQVVAVVADSGHGLITYPRGLNTAHQSAERAGVPAGLIFRKLDGGGETVEQIRRTLDRAAFRARNDEAVILVGTTGDNTLAAIMEWAAGNRAESVTIAPISAALLNQ